MLTYDYLKSMHVGKIAHFKKKRKETEHCNSRGSILNSFFFLYTIFYLQ